MLRAWDISSSHVSKFKRLSELELQVCWHGINKPINEMLLVAWLLIQRNSLFDIPKSDNELVNCFIISLGHLN